MARFERLRSAPALVVIAVLALIALIALPPAAVGASLVGFLLMAVLTFSWSRTARKAAASALEFTRLSSVRVSDRGLAVARETGKMDVAWSEVLHATRTQTGWIFVAKKSCAAVVLPAKELTDAQKGQLEKLLSAWPMRKYRRAPW